MTPGVRELTCRDLADFLADYFAGELSLDERSVFEGHLAECPDCAAYLRSYAETIRLARGAYADDPLPGPKWTDGWLARVQQLAPVVATDGTIEVNLFGMERGKE